MKRALIVEESLSKGNGREAFSHQSPEVDGLNLTGSISPAPTLGEGEHLARKKRRESEPAEDHPPDQGSLKVPKMDFFIKPIFEV